MMSVLFAATLLGVVGCGSGSSNEPRGGTLTGARWVLAAYFVKGEESVVPGGVTSDATFTAKRVGGNAGVNQYGGPYEADTAAGTISIGDVTSTMMAGPPDATEVESAVFAGLKAATSYYADDKSLTLYDKDDNPVLVYDKDTGGIVGVDWIVTGYNNGKEAVVSPIAGTDLTALFEKANQLTGFAGVNNYSGEYKVDGAKITVGPLASTKMAGDPALMEQETLFLAALGSAATYSLQGDKLELRNGEDAIAVTFVRK